MDSERAAVEHDLALREAALAAEQTKLAAALERLRFQRPRESAAAKQVKTLEEARRRAEVEREEAERREAEARENVEKNLAALQSRSGYGHQTGTTHPPPLGRRHRPACREHGRTELRCCPSTPHRVGRTHSPALYSPLQRECRWTGHARRP